MDRRRYKVPAQHRKRYNRNAYGRLNHTRLSGDGTSIDGIRYNGNHQDAPLKPRESISPSYSAKMQSIDSVKSPAPMKQTMSDQAAASTAINQKNFSPNHVKPSAARVSRIGAKPELSTQGSRQPRQGQNEYVHKLYQDELYREQKQRQKIEQSLDRSANAFKEDNELADVQEGRPKKPLQYYLAMSAAAIVFLLGIGVSIHTFMTNRQVKKQVTTVLADTTSNDSVELSPGSLPDESDQDPDVVRNHQVAPDKPRYLRIPKIGVDHRIIEVGVSTDNQLGSPASIHDVGWYRNSAKPGQDGASLMDGHVSGPTQPGVFRNLIKLNVGDLIEVERGDGEIITYEVRQKQSYPYAETDMHAALRSIEHGKHALNLITCDGKFNAATNNYEDRLIVFAVEV